jgi:hypothetical protein
VPIASTSSWFKCGDTYTDGRTVTGQPNFSQNGIGFRATYPAFLRPLLFSLLMADGAIGNVRFAREVRLLALLGSGDVPREFVEADRKGWDRSYT